MRAFLSVAFLAIGIAIGGAFPRVSEVVQGALAAAGLTNGRPTPPTNTAVTEPPVTQTDDGHGHSEHGHEHADGEDETTPNLSSLRRYELRSPLSGRVVERKVDVGTAVGKEGDPADIYTVADLSSVWIELAVPTVELPKVRDGAKVTILGGDDAPRAEGKVVFVSPILTLAAHGRSTPDQNLRGATVPPLVP